MGIKGYAGGIQASPRTTYSRTLKTARKISTPKPFWHSSRKIRISCNGACTLFAAKRTTGSCVFGRASGRHGRGNSERILKYQNRQLRHRFPWRFAEKDRFQQRHAACRFSQGGPQEQRSPIGYPVYDSSIGGRGSIAWTVYQTLKEFTALH